MFKKIWNWFIEIIKETLNLSWTLVGLVIATLTLTGSAQQVTGLATLVTLGVWLLTIRFRNRAENVDIYVAVAHCTVKQTRRKNETTSSKNTIRNRCN